MVNVNKLKAKIVELGMNVEQLSISTGIERSKLYRRLSGGGEEFTIKEADCIAKTLQMTRDEVNAIFFSQYVA